MAGVRVFSWQSTPGSRYGPAVSTPVARRPDRATREVVNTDRRWFLFAAAVFALSIASFAGAFAVYRWTGPHPRITLLIRRARAFARWVIPRQKRPPKWWS